MIKLLQGDCLDKMKEIKDNSIDIIISSPPYEDITGAGYASKTKDVLFLKLYTEFLDKVFKEKKMDKFFLMLKVKHYIKH